MRIRDGKNSDPGSEMEKIRIRDKHPGSAKLLRPGTNFDRIYSCANGGTEVDTVPWTSRRQEEQLPPGCIPAPTVERPAAESGSRSGYLPLRIPANKKETDGWLPYEKQVAKFERDD
jgi:hypothetical protein